MEKQSNLKEILLLTGTSFSARQYREKEEPAAGSSFTERERLEAACWNGLLKEMLPEIFQGEDKHLYLWQITEAESFLELDLSESPQVKEPNVSLDPYAFLPCLVLN
jgi:hypothetical protein